MSKFQFTKRVIAQSSHDDSHDDTSVDFDDFEMTEQMHACIDDAEDMALLLIASGVDAAELAAFAKVTAVLAKGSYNKEVTLVVQRKWTKTIDEGAQLKIPKIEFQKAYDTRTTINKSIVNALAAFLHLGKSSQMYVSTLPGQENRKEIPDKFVESFSAYDQVTTTDSQTSQEFLVKSVKSGVESYKSMGGVTCVVDLPINSEKIVPTIVRAANAYQKDKSPLVSKISDPFHFVCTKIDVPKHQSLEHMAMRRVLPFCPRTMFYSVDDKMSMLDLENHQLTSLPDTYAPYVKFKTLGGLGDVLTNHGTYDKLGVDYVEVNDFSEIPVNERKYDDVQLEFPDGIQQCVELMSSPGYFDAPEGFIFGKFGVDRFVPARFGRCAGVDDLDKYPDQFQLIQLGVLAGARKKSGYIFNAFRFYLVDVASHVCLAVPVGYISEFASFSDIEANKLRAVDYLSLFVTTNNVEQYIAASSEVNSLMFPLLWKFYRDLSLFKDLPLLVNKTFESVKDSVNGTSFSRIVNLFCDQFDSPYVFLVGSEKIDDRRVMNFCNEARLDLLTDYKSGSVKNKSVGPSVDVVKKRRMAFTFSGGKDVDSRGDVPLPPASADPVNDSSGSVGLSQPMTDEERQAYLTETGL